MEVLDQDQDQEWGYNQDGSADLAGKGVMGYNQDGSADLAGKGVRACN